MEYKDLSDEQKKAITKLKIGSFFSGVFVGIKTLITLFLLNVVTNMFNIVFLQSKTFVTVTAIINGILAFTMMLRDMEEVKRNIKEEAKKIVGKNETNQVQ